MPPVEQRPAWWSDPTGWLREGIEQKRGSSTTDQFGRPTQEGLIDGFVGGLVNADDGKDYRSAATKEKWGTQIEALEGKFIPGQTEDQYKAEVRRLTQLRNNTEHGETAQGKAQTAQIEQLTASTKQAGQRLEHEIETSRNDRTTAAEQFKYLQNKDDNRFALQNAQRLDDKAEARRERLDLLDRQDHRYAQEMQRYDKRRREESIQGLVGGLAALGAAFAV
jgi:hypothetical protein